jgi:predicted  nucleic acid-binding Zn-ribbon protein
MQEDMQLQSDNTNTNKDRTWDRDEIAELIQYAKHLQQENEDLQAKMIMMNAKLGNEESKVKQLQMLIKQLTQYTA